ncbi:MAG: hypothetical protein FWH20_08290 [Oscillospiraceae bacterium]|nr:hypothetical protein [Oscillospiraceae bacterium]
MNTYNIKRHLLSVVYPNRCPFCGKLIDPLGFYCEPCLELDFYENNGNSQVYCCVYNDKSKPLITKAKENADGYAISAIAGLLQGALATGGVLPEIAFPPDDRKGGNAMAVPSPLSAAIGGERLGLALPNANKTCKIDFIAAVPPRKAGLQARGYSLPALLAREIAEMSGVKYCKNLLRLTRQTREQKELSAAERKENLRDAFVVNPQILSRVDFGGKGLLIIDDVSTTGATLREARRAVESAGCGVGQIYLAAFAKTANTAPTPITPQPPTPQAPPPQTPPH